MPDASAPAELRSEQAADTIRSRPYLGLLVVAAVIGVIVALLAWCLVELVCQLQHELYKHLPHALGYHNVVRAGPEPTKAGAGEPGVTGLHSDTASGLVAPHPSARWKPL